MDSTVRLKCSIQTLNCTKLVGVEREITNVYYGQLVCIFGISLP